MRINFSRKEFLILLLSIVTSLFAFSLSYAEENSSQAPIIMVKGETVMTVNLGEKYIDEGVIAYDFQQGFITQYVTSNGEVNTSIPGVYIITYSVRDTDGNYADEKRRTITIKGNTIQIVEPKIESYEVGKLEEGNTLKMSFKTNQEVQAVIGYGLEEKYTMFTTPDRIFTKTSHTHKLSNIEAGKRYSYIIYVRNEAGNSTYIKGNFTTDFEEVDEGKNDFGDLGITNLQDGEEINSTQKLEFTKGSKEITEWIIRTGTEENTRKYDESPRLSSETTQYTLKNIPSGENIFVRLYYKTLDGKWNEKKYNFIVSSDTSGVNPPPVEYAPNTPVTNNSNWDNTQKPPVLSNPLIIEISDTYKTSKVSDFDRVNCEGLLHQINIPSGKDAKVVMKKGSKPLKYPVWISGGRNVQVIGLDIRPIIQDGCDIGEATQVRVKNKNIHPRLPGGKTLRVAQSGTTFIEGLNIELQGMEADCVVLRNDGNMSEAEQKANRKFHMVNSRCTGYEGLDSDASDIGDGIHGDFYQNQGSDQAGELVFENITVWGSSNGITSHKWKTVKLELFKLRNYSYQLDERYHGDDKYEKSQGLVFSAHVEEKSSAVFENVWINDGRYYGKLSGYHNSIDRVGAVSQSNYILKHPEFFKGKPKTEFAPLKAVGINYISSF